MLAQIAEACPHIRGEGRTTDVNRPTDTDRSLFAPDWRQLHPGQRCQYSYEAETIEQETEAGRGLPCAASSHQGEENAADNRPKHPRQIEEHGIQGDGVGQVIAA